METMLMMFACKAIEFNNIKLIHEQLATYVGFKKLKEIEIAKQFEIKYNQTVYLENGNSKIIFELVYQGNDDKYKNYLNFDYPGLVEEYYKAVLYGYDVECLTHKIKGNDQ